MNRWYWHRTWRYVIYLAYSIVKPNFTYQNRHTYELINLIRHCSVSYVRGETIYSTEAIIKTLFSSDDFVQACAYISPCTNASQIANCTSNTCFNIMFNLCVFGSPNIYHDIFIYIYLYLYIYIFIRKLKLLPLFLENILTNIYNVFGIYFV